MPTYFVRGNQTSFSFEADVFPVVGGKVTLPDGVAWYKDLVGVMLFSKPEDIPAVPLPTASGSRSGAFFDVSDKQPEPDVPVGFATPAEVAGPTPVVQDAPVEPAPVEAALPAAPAAETPAAAPATRKPRAAKHSP